MSLGQDIRFGLELGLGKNIRFWLGLGQNIDFGLEDEIIIGLRRDIGRALELVQGIRWGLGLGKDIGFWLGLDQDS